VNGDGFITLEDGSMRWGLFGAAGVLARAGELLFVAQRSLHCHQGGTWAIPGGALQRDEAAVDGALREFAEEIGVDLADFEVTAVHEDNHGGWSYWTVVVDLPAPFTPPDRLHWETAATAWVTAAELVELDLHPGFRDMLGRLSLLS
jgi:ADP-ribose pyrophosphatase YjhB (NUDIX family)